MSSQSSPKQPEKYRAVYVDESHRVALTEKPKRVWTALPVDVEPKSIPEKLVHHENAFMEDETHDWSWKNGVLRYYSRCVEQDEPAWIWIEV